MSDDSDLQMLPVDSVGHTGGRRGGDHDDDSQGPPIAKRFAVSGPDRGRYDDLREDTTIYKDDALNAKKKERLQAVENQNLRSQLDAVQHQMVQMNQQMHENAAQQLILMNQVVASNQIKNNLMHHNEGLFHELQATRHLREEQNKQVQEYSQATLAQQKQLYDELKNALAEKAEEEKKAREYERAAIEKANEAATLQAKIANQASGYTPRARRAKVMSQVELRNISSRVPVIPFTPVPIPAAADSPMGEDTESSSPTVASGNLDMPALARELYKLFPGAAAAVKSPKKGRVSSKLKPVLVNISRELELQWKASLIRHRTTIGHADYHQAILRETKEAKCNVETAEEFILKTPPSETEVQQCEEGLLQPHKADFRFDFNDGYRNSRWNNIVLGKLVNAAITSGNHLDPVPAEWLLEKLKGQLVRAHEAWGRAQPRGNETTNAAIARANAYREERQESSRGNSSKFRKFTTREHTIQCLINIKSAKRPQPADLEAWKRLLQMLRYLGNDGMSSEEEGQIANQHGVRASVFRIKIYVWRSAEVGQYLRMVDTMEGKISVKRQGPRAATRVRDGTESVSGAPKGLPECLYDAEWIKKMTAKSPVFYEDLQVSPEAFSLLAASADMVE